MQRPREISRVIVVVLDGLRPDAIALYGLRHIWRLAQQGASTFAGSTVAPSVTSPQYGTAARHLDAALGLLAAIADADTDRSTVLIALADHGGGGVCRTHHNSDHRHDRTIPIVVAGGLVQPGVLRRSASLLDVPATVAWALGVTAPASYAGEPLVEAFTRAREPLLVAATA